MKLGNALAGEITSHSGIHRRNVYDSIERLIEKFKLSEKVPERARKYMEEAKSELFIPGSGMEEELEKLRKAA